jgi:hypothetical protein
MILCLKSFKMEVGRMWENQYFCYKNCLLSTFFLFLMNPSLKVTRLYLSSNFDCKTMEAWILNFKWKRKRDRERVTIVFRHLNVGKFFSLTLNISFCGLEEKKLIIREWDRNHIILLASDVGEAKLVNNQFVTNLNLS